MHPRTSAAALLLCILLLAGCGERVAPTVNHTGGEETTKTIADFGHAPAAYNLSTSVESVRSDPAFGEAGRLLFPVRESYWRGDRLGDLSFTWYSHVDPDETVAVLNDLRARADAGEPFFLDIYSEEERAADPAKADTGLFYFPGEPGRSFAICNPGGGFAYVAAIHDGFPHAYELSQLGYHGFALIYRPGWETAMEDLARAIDVVFGHADELGIDTACYSLWGGSAGARMAATLGTYGPAAFGYDLPRPGAAIMQYTGHREYSADDPPTYACVGTSDGIADWRVMRARLDAMERAGIPTEFHVYEGLPHGFGLGTGTVAEGWFDDAVAFWEAQMPT